MRFQFFKHKVRRVATKGIKIAKEKEEDEEEDEEKEEEWPLEISIKGTKTKIHKMLRSQNLLRQEKCGVDL